MLSVKRVELYLVAMKLVEPFETSFGRTEIRQAVLVKVVDHEGDEGWGEIPAERDPLYSHEFAESEMLIVREYIARELVGAQMDTPMDYWRLRSVTSIRGHEFAKAGVEFALWDLYAKKLGKPLWRLLGGVRDRIASGVSIGIQRSLDELVKKVTYYLDRGYQRVKIKIKPGWDVNAVEAIRKEFPEIPLMVDANAAYRLNNYMVFVELDKHDLLMIEQPLHYRDLHGHARLQRLIRTPICLDESIRSPTDVVRAYELDAARVINLKPARVGGIKPSLEVEALTRAAGLGLWIGGMLETGVGRGFLVALATLAGVNYPNDISASDRYYEEDIVEPPWQLEKGGWIRAPRRPGIGVEVLEEKVKKHSRKSLTIAR